jgi:putative hemolysin
MPWYEQALYEVMHVKRENIIAILIFIATLLYGCTGNPGTIGGQKDVHGCLTAAGYSWDTDVGACTRSWEITGDLRKAAGIAVAPLSYPVTVVSVETQDCDGCYVVELQRNDNHAFQNITLAGWSVKPATCGQCPELVPPAPGFCANGTVVPGEMDLCGCRGPPKCLVACTEEAKICPDGTAVGRNPANNCEFVPCPPAGNESGLANPASVFCEKTGGKLEIRDEPGGQAGYCVFRDGSECDEWAYFRGECPAPHNCTAEEKQAEICPMIYAPVCGDDGLTYPNSCQACSGGKIDAWKSGECPNMTYVSRDPQECKVIKFLCVQGKEPFTDEFGCGCRTAASSTETKNFCTPDERDQLCTQEHVPACGWWNESIKCIRYPCAMTYGNKCMACADPKVAYWTDGDCPAG